MHHKERPGGLKKFEDNELICSIFQELSNKLAVDESIVSRHLHAMGKVQTVGKWVPHELTENATSMANRNIHDHKGLLRV